MWFDSLWMLPPSLFLLEYSALSRLCLCLQVLWPFQILLLLPVHGEKCRQINTQNGYLINHNF